MIASRPQDGSLPRRPRQAVSQTPPGRTVPRPVPERQKRDAKGYQVEQLRRRYAPRETTTPGGDTHLLFRLAPSDPDFPFELDHLECDLLVPASYPSAPPQLRVKNSDVPRGFAINIERGWDKLVRERPGATLLALTNALDKKLEEFLTERKTDTVKLTVFKDTRGVSDKAPPSSSSSAAASASGPATSTPPAEPQPAPRRYVPEPSFTREQIAEAQERRAQETRQLEARMSRMSLYQRSSDGVVYTLPLDPRRRSELPTGLQAVKSVQLIVPLLYPLQPLRVLLNDVESRDAEVVEELFVRKAAENKKMTLMGHLNFLTQNVHVLAAEAARSSSEGRPDQQGGAPSSAEEEADARVKEAEHFNSLLDEGKAHIRVIPRPPEWEFGARREDGSSDESSSSYDDDDDDDDDDGDEEGPGEHEDTTAASGMGASVGRTVERGTALTFPAVELRGVELLQVSVLNINVRCERCRTVNETTGLKDGAEKAGSCTKCAHPFAVRFRQELVHRNVARAGFIDAAGCSVADLLPSTFIPTCANCSTPAAGLVAVRGDAVTNVCRECHSRFTFKIPDVKFLLYEPGSSANLRAPSNRQQHNNNRDRSAPLIRAGEPLPDRGACAHYRRSHRWFRFSCCNRVHACDRCHDAAEDHAHEWAARMICGWCAREQRYSPESCAFCGRSVIGRRGKGYWEGGKGTRDRVLMRRGDKRKYRRLGAGALSAAKEKE